jgi:hypothetical protein
LKDLFHHDFRGQPLPNNIQVVGKPENDFIKEEPAGFRITLPKTWIHAFGGVGCKTNFTIKGDFEATGTFEILHADVPTKGFGVGASLRVQTGGVSPKGSTFARVVRAGGNQILAWDHGPLEDGKFAGGIAKCSEKRLRLRLKRTGTTLHYQWAPGFEGDKFEEIRAEKNFGEDDIIAVRMSVVTGREPCDVDVRFVQLRIRSGGMVEANAKGGVAVAPPKNPGNPPDEIPKGRNVLLFVLLFGFGLLVVLLSSLAVLLLSRRRAAAEPIELETAEPAVIAFQCSACGKKLQAKAMTAGKRIKCVKCGELTAVPEGETA